jgi:hypothetical protein
MRKINVVKIKHDSRFFFIKKKYKAYLFYIFFKNFYKKTCTYIDTYILLHLYSTKNLFTQFSNIKKLFKYEF